MDNESQPPVTPADAAVAAASSTPEAPSAEQAAVLESADDIAQAEKLKAGYERVTREIRKVIIGQHDVVEQVLLTLFVGGNSIITGVPGLPELPVLPPMRA